MIKNAPLFTTGGGTADYNFVIKFKLHGDLKNIKVRNFPGSPVAKTPIQGARAQSLVGELGST